MLRAKKRRELSEAEFQRVFREVRADINAVQLHDKVFGGVLENLTRYPRLGSNFPAFFGAFYAAVTIALLYTQYFSTLPVAIQQLAFVAVAWRRARRGESVRQLMIGCWILWAALTLALLPLAPFVAQQFAHDQSSGTGFSNVPASAGNPAGSSPSVYSLLSNLVWAVWGYHANSTMLAIGALWPLLMLLALALLGRGRSPESMLVLALSVIPPVVLMAIGFKDRFLFVNRYAPYVNADTVTDTLEKLKATIAALQAANHG